MPRWYFALFLTNLLERFGFYGLQAVLVLYASTPADHSGLGLSTTDSASLFGAWLALTFTLSLPGGWVGDRLLGPRRSLVFGSVLAAIGYALLAVPLGWVNGAGLGALAVGLGLYMPNYQAQGNGMLDDQRDREKAVSFIYVASQASALLGPIVAGYLGEVVSWPLAFAVCAVAVLLAGANIAAQGRSFGGAGLTPHNPLDPSARRVAARRTGIALAVVALLLVGLGLARALTPSTAIALAGLVGVLAPIVGYRWLLRDRQLTSEDRRRLKAFLAVFLGATLFWTIIAHSASLLNLFGRDHVDRSVLGFTFPASWLQALTPLFMLVLAPVIASVLPRIGRRNAVPVKFATGLLLVGGGFLVMALAALLAQRGLVSPAWLAVVYLTSACGEVVIAAVSIAATSSVLPRQFMSRMLGMYWLFAALGGALGAAVVRVAAVVPEWTYYAGLGSVTAIAGICFAVGRDRLTAAIAPADRTVEPV